MAGRVEDYAIVGDMQSVAQDHGHWRIAPEEELEGSEGLGRPTASHIPLVQTALNLEGHVEEHRRGPWDERRTVPG